jgi:uncharacterized protein (DUF58 family)
MDFPRPGDLRGLRPPRPTRDGQAVAGLTAALMLVAGWTGNNLVALLVAVGIATLLVAGVAAWWNLRGIELARVLPVEVFAGVEGRGRYVVRNRRRLMAAIDLHVEEAHGVGAIAPRVLAGDEAGAAAGWRVDDRGVARLGAVRVWSVFPFGLWTASRTLELPAEILVYPRPGGGRPLVEAGPAGLGDGSRRGGDPGDFAGLRPYRAGDPLRAIHWRTSARAGEPIVVERAGAGVERVIVRVVERPGDAFERELARACGELLRAFALDVPVGLELPDAHHEARTGPAWRRNLLAALATAPRRG